MSLQTIEINNVAINFDREKTLANRTDNNQPCDCQNCRNYYHIIGQNTDLIEFLTGFGLDYQRPEEVIPFEMGDEKDSLIWYNTYYCVVGSIDKEFQWEQEDYTIFFHADSHVNVGREVTDKFFFIEVDITLPYLLDEERELPPPTFTERVTRKLRSLFR